MNEKSFIGETKNNFPSPKTTFFQTQKTKIEKNMSDMTFNFQKNNPIVGLHYCLY